MLKDFQIYCFSTKYANFIAKKKDRSRKDFGQILMGLTSLQPFWSKVIYRGGLKLIYNMSSVSLFHLK